MALQKRLIWVDKNDARKHYCMYVEKDEFKSGHKIQVRLGNCCEYVGLKYDSTTKNIRSFDGFYCLQKKSDGDEVTVGVSGEELMLQVYFYKEPLIRVKSGVP